MTDQATLDTIRDLYTTGVATRDIAEIVGLPQITVSRIADKSGWRRPGYALRPKSSKPVAAYNHVVAPDKIEQMDDDQIAALYAGRRYESLALVTRAPVSRHLQAPAPVSYTGCAAAMCAR